MIKKSLFFLALLLSMVVFSQQPDSYALLNTKTLANKIRLNYTLVHMPDEQAIYSNFQLRPTMGFVGLNYNIPINDWLYTSTRISKRGS